MKKIRTVLIAALLFVVALSGCASSDYKKAVATSEAGDLETAIKLFTELGDYKDSASLLSEARKQYDYNAAVSATDSGDYAAAVELFKALGDYKDSNTRLADAECNYNYAIAVAAAKTGAYKEAAPVFASLGDFKDSKEYAYACNYFRLYDLLSDFPDSRLEQSFPDVEKYKHFITKPCIYGCVANDTLILSYAELEKNNDPASKHVYRTCPGQFQFMIYIPKPDLEHPEIPKSIAWTMTSNYKTTFDDQGGQLKLMDCSVEGTLSPMNCFSLSRIDLDTIDMELHLGTMENDHIREEDIIARAEMLFRNINLFLERTGLGITAADLQLQDYDIEYEQLVNQH